MGPIGRVWRVGRELVVYSAQQRQWWLLLLVTVLGTLVAVASFGHAAAPYTLYAFF